jgi:hypothetical protein
LVVGVLDVSQELTSLSHQGEAATEEVSSRAHLGWVDVGLRKHASSKEGGDLESIDAVVLGLASVNGLHVQSVAENEVDAFPSTEVGEPVPGEHALRRDHQVLAERSDGVQEDVGVGGQVSMKKDLPLLVEHAGVHVSCVQVDAAVVLVGSVVESHSGSLLSRVCHRSLAYPQ